MHEINFFYEDTPFSLDQAAATSKWVTHIVTLENHQVKAVNFIFCSDQYLHKINLDYLNHDNFTDIITFDNKEENGLLEADIFISIERVMENARELNKPFQTELNRVIIHGILHLIGYQDKTSDQKKEMRKKEEACLSLRNQF